MDVDTDDNRTVFQFVVGELRWVGSDYGVASLEGCSEEARRAVVAIGAATGRRGCVVECELRVTVTDGEKDFHEIWHAGLAGTPESGAIDAVTGETRVVGDDDQRREASVADAGAG